MQAIIAPDSDSLQISNYDYYNAPENQLINEILYASLLMERAARILLFKGSLGDSIETIKTEL